MKTFASLFTGGGGADIGAMQAGYKPIWGIEYIPEIAAVCQANLHHPVIVKSLLDVDPTELEPPDWLHMSPPCPNFSSAKTGGSETDNDLALSHKMREFITTLSPEFVSIENVQGYTKSASLLGVWYELLQAGYFVDWWILNAADYGVPQTRRRFFLIARKESKPIKPLPTHQKQRDLFSDQWLGWYGALGEIVTDLPNSRLADWQNELLPAAFNEPGRVYAVSGIPNNYSTSVTVRDATQPIFTITASNHKHPPIGVNGRQFALAGAGVAALQSFPQWYRFTNDKITTSKIIGNAVPPLLMQRIMEAQL